MYLCVPVPGSRCLVSWRPGRGGSWRGTAATPPTHATWTGKNPPRTGPRDPEIPGTGRDTGSWSDRPRGLDGPDYRYPVSRPRTPGQLALATWTQAPTVRVTQLTQAPGASRLRSLPEPVKYPRQRTHNKAYGAPPSASHRRLYRSTHHQHRVGIKSQQTHN